MMVLIGMVARRTLISPAPDGAMRRERLLIERLTGDQVLPTLVDVSRAEVNDAIRSPEESHMGQVRDVSAKTIYAAHAAMQRLQAERSTPGLLRTNGDGATNRWRGPRAVGMLLSPSPGGPWRGFGRLTGMLGAAVF